MPPRKTWCKWTSLHVAHVEAVRNNWKGNLTQDQTGKFLIAVTKSDSTTRSMFSSSMAVFKAMQALQVDEFTFPEVKWSIPQKRLKPKPEEKKTTTTKKDTSKKPTPAETKLQQQVRRLMSEVKVEVKKRKNSFSTSSTGLGRFAA